MGAKQSRPAAANGRTRAYSSSDLPSSGNSGGANGTAGGGGASAAAGRFSGSGAQRAPAQRLRRRRGGLGGPAQPLLGTGSRGDRGVEARAAQSAFSIPNSSSGPYGSQDSVHSSPEDGGSSGGRDRPASGGPGGPRLVIAPYQLTSRRTCFGYGPFPLCLPRAAWAAAAHLLLPFSFSPSARAPGVRRAAGPGHPLFGVGGKRRAPLNPCSAATAGP